MLQRLPILLGLLFIISISATAQDRVELFAGYTFERYGASPARYLNGWEVTGKYKLASILGIAADLDAHYGLPSRPDARVLDFMVGPQISLPGPFSPYVHALAGIGHVHTGNADTSFAGAVGGGIDMHLVPLISWRVIQADDVVTRFFGGTQHSLRLATGVVIRF